MEGRGHGGPMPNSMYCFPILIGSDPCKYLAHSSIAVKVKPLSCECIMHASQGSDGWSNVKVFVVSLSTISIWKQEYDRLGN